MTMNTKNAMLMYPKMGYTTLMTSPKPNRLPAHTSRQDTASSTLRRRCTRADFCSKYAIMPTRLAKALQNMATNSITP